MATSNSPKYLIKSSSHFRSQVTSRSIVGKTIDNIKSKLNSAQQEMFRATRFGQFFDVDLTFNGQLIHYFLLREVEELRDKCISFMVGEEVITFGRTDFNLVTGLWPSLKSSFVQQKVNNRIRKMYFEDKATIYGSDVENVFLKYEGDDDDGVKLALIYLIEIGLLGKEKKLKADTSLWGYIDDLNSFNDYDWGSLIYERTLWGLKQALSKVKERKKGTVDRYTLVGFPHSLQVWAYESISTLSGCVAKKISEDAIPRMLRWSCVQSPSSSIIHSEVFDIHKMKIKARLEASKDETFFARGGPPLKPCLMASTDSLALPSNSNIHNMASKGSKANPNGGKNKRKSKPISSKKYKELKTQFNNLENEMEIMRGDMERMRGDVNLLRNDMTKMNLIISTILKSLGITEQGGKEDAVAKDNTVRCEDVGTSTMNVINDVTDIERPSTPSWLKMPNDEHAGVEHALEHTPTHNQFAIHSVSEISPIKITQEESDVTEISPSKVIRPYVRAARKKRSSVHIITPFTTLSKRPKSSNTIEAVNDASNTYNPMHVIPPSELDRLRRWITDKRTDNDLVDTITGKKSKIFFRDIFMCRRWLSDEHLDTMFLFLRLKLKAKEGCCAQNFTTVDTVFLRHLEAKWNLYEQCVQANHPFDWQTEYRLVDYIIGCNPDFKDAWANVDVVYAPFNVKSNHWVLICFDLMNCEIKVWDSIPSYSTVDEMTQMLEPVRTMVPAMLQSTGFFARRGGSTKHTKSWPVVKVDSIPSQQNTYDCGVFTIKFFEYIVTGSNFCSLRQENMMYFRRQLGFQLWTNTPMY